MRARNARNERAGVYEIMIPGKEDSLLPLEPILVLLFSFARAKAPFLFSCRGIVPAMARRLIYWAVNYVNAHFLVS